MHELINRSKWLNGSMTDINYFIRCVEEINRRIINLFVTNDMIALQSGSQRKPLKINSITEYPTI